MPGTFSADRTKNAAARPRLTALATVLAVDVCTDHGKPTRDAWSHAPPSARRMPVVA